MNPVRDDLPDRNLGWVNEIYKREEIRDGFAVGAASSLREGIANEAIGQTRDELLQSKMPLCNRDWCGIA